VIKSSSELPSTLKPGTYSEQQMKDLLTALSKVPKIEASTGPHIIMELGKTAQIESLSAKFTGIQLTKKNQSFLLSGVFQGSNPYITIPFSEPIAINESIIKRKGNTAVIIGLEKAE
jgi:hypothetical protein